MMHNSFEDDDITDDGLVKKKEEEEEEEEDERELTACERLAALLTLTTPDADEDAETSNYDLVGETAFITIGVSTIDGIMVDIEGDNESLLISLLVGLLNGEINEDILDGIDPKYRAFFPSWGDEEPMLYPDQNLWEGVDENE
jgi:hypothetical protein